MGANSYKTFTNTVNKMYFMRIDVVIKSDCFDNQRFLKNLPCLTHARIKQGKKQAPRRCHLYKFSHQFHGAGLSKIVEVLFLERALRTSLIINGVY